MQTNKEIIEAYTVELWAEKDLSAINRYFDKDAVIHSPLNRTKGRVTMKDMVEKWLVAFPDLQIQVIDFISEGPMVVCRWRALGTHLGSFFDTRPTHKEVAFSGVTTYRLDAGKVVEYWALVDMHTILSQLGEFHSIAEVVE